MLLKKKKEFENQKGKENILIQTSSNKKGEQQVKHKLLLPKDLLYKLFLFLTPKEINKLIRTLNNQYLQLINQQFWNYYNRYNPLQFDDLYSKFKFLQERRSKGKLYQVCNRLTGQYFVLRELDTIKANANHNDGIQTSVLREISYVKSLKSHENIASIVQVKINNPIVQILYDYYPLNLREQLKKTDLSIEQIKSLFLQICRGVEYLHQNHILHRNLKPDNIFIINKIVKISDFGMSRLETFPIIPYTPEDPKERERSNREVKRLWYRAPEMLFRKQYYSCEIDSWSLGCILAEMALRSPLFNGKTEIEYLFEVFQFLGSPDDNDWNSISSDVKFKFPQWKKYNLQINELNKNDIIDIIQNRKQIYEKLLTLNTILGKDGIDLLQKLLCIKPENRLDIIEIIQHPFLNAINQNIQIHYLEPKFKEYLEFQIEINQTMRSTLIDWLIDVCIHFELMDETLHLSIIYIDLVLSKIKISKKNLQLIGVTSLKLADVYNERSKEYFKQENCNAYAYITADEYNEQQIIDMEQQILQILDYNLSYRTPIQILKIINSKLKVSTESQLLSYYFCDFFIMGYEQLIIERQLYAICCLLLALNTKNEQINSNQQFQFTEKDVTEALDRLYNVWQFIKLQPQINSLDACMQRHKHLNPRDIQLNIPNSEFITQFLK
ncbi:unnamed protein product [Paramecium pentaurelia]|uniref:Cyclin-dependent kinase 2 homolog n=1 Tax=Paramecium pentaurelia TaxID=43138 RepID=A0A8S1W2D6_9CILI|nr:unnamed protein product [Paramecium pentaurelia]